MTSAKKLFWIAAAATMVLGYAVCVSRAAKVQEAAFSTIQTTPLKPPANGPINVAFVISEGADVMDIAGPWEVFSDTMLTSKGKPWHETDGMDDMLMPFRTYTVSDSLKPVKAANGLMIVPNYSFETAPKPQVIVVPAQDGRSDAQKAWLLSNSATADVTMSVCTGASMLTQYGASRGRSEIAIVTRDREQLRESLGISSARPSAMELARKQAHSHQPERSIQQVPAH